MKAIAERALDNLQADGPPTPTFAPSIRATEYLRRRTVAWADGVGRIDRRGHSRDRRRLLGLPRRTISAMTGSTAPHAGSRDRAPSHCREAQRRAGAERAHRAEWISPVRIDPFTIPMERSCISARVDAELREEPGVTLAETSLVSHGSGSCSSPPKDRGSIRRAPSPARDSAHSFGDNEIQKRSYPNSFGGQYQLKGYELVDELRLLENAPRIAEEAVALHSADQCPEGDVRPDPRQLAARRCRSTNRSAIRSSSTACSAARPTTPA